MADWPDIQDTQCDPDAPVTSELIYGLRDGPIAIAEGAIDAPRIARRVEVYLPSSGWIVVQRPTNYTGFFMHVQVADSVVGGDSVVISASANGTTWTANVSMGLISGGSGFLAYQFENGIYKAAFRGGAYSGSIPSLPADANYLRIGSSSGGAAAVTSALVEFTGGFAP